MRRVGRLVAARLADVVHARSDADHRARGWQARRGAWGRRRYRLDVATWLDTQMDRAGAALSAAPGAEDGNEWLTSSTPQSSESSVRGRGRGDRGEL